MLNERDFYVGMKKDDVIAILERNNVQYLTLWGKYNIPVWGKSENDNAIVWYNGEFRFSPDLHLIEWFFKVERKEKIRANKEDIDAFFDSIF